MPQNTFQMEQRFKYKNKATETTQKTWVYDYTEVLNFLMEDTIKQNQNTNENYVQHLT